MLFIVQYYWSRNDGNETSEPVEKLSTILPIVADLAYNKHMSNKLSKMITLEITIEEAKAYAEALDRALDNPFIQDDDECSPLFTLSGKLDGAIDAELDPVV